MNPKITKLRGELNKNNEKIAGLQAKNREIERQLRELENAEIIGMVRETGMTLDDFAALFQNLKGASIIPDAAEGMDGA